MRIHMRQLGYGLLAWCLVASTASAGNDAVDALVDALVPVDPTTQLESGTGATYEPIYSPQQNAAPQEVESDLPYYGEYYEGLRTPWYETDEGQPAERSTLSNSTDVAPIETGQWYDREGVVVYEQSSPAQEPFEF